MTDVLKKKEGISNGKEKIKIGKNRIEYQVVFVYSLKERERKKGATIIIEILAITFSKKK